MLEGSVVPRYVVVDEGPSCLSVFFMMSFAMFIVAKALAIAVAVVFYGVVAIACILLFVKLALWISSKWPDVPSEHDDGG